jgi:hypothetical protein
VNDADRSTSSQEDSPAKTSRARGRKKASTPTEAVCGGRCNDSSENSDPVGCLLRTSILCVSTALTKYSVRWKRSVTALGRSWWVLGREERRITENGLGLWATPNTMDCLPPRSLDAMRKSYLGVRKGRSAPCNLREQVHPEMYPEALLPNWPTATARDGKGGYQGGRIRDGKISVDTLDCAVQAYRPGGLLAEEPSNTSGSNLASCGLNPAWVEQLMGYPVGWTKSTTQESSHSETQ